MLQGPVRGGSNEQCLKAEIRKCLHDIGYLGAGLLIGPSGLHLVGNTEQISQISELGIVLMLFVIGMELSPQRLWVMRRSVFGAGSLQMAITALAIGGIAVAIYARLDDWKRGRR